MPNPSRVTAGIPTGGQFAATQRGESDVHLVDEEEAADPGRHLAEVRARFSHLPTSERGPLASDFIDKTRAVGMSNPEALAYLDAGVLDADTAIGLRAAATASEDEDREAPTVSQVK